MSRLFHKSIYNNTKIAQSYWEDTIQRSNDYSLDSNRDLEAELYDVIIIGGGYTGLNAALELCGENDLRVAVLDAGVMAWGASGRNGGFCCLPATKMSVEAMTKKYGEDATREFWDSQLDAIDYVSNICQDYGLTVDIQGRGNLEVAHNAKAFDGLKTYGETLSKKFGIEVETYSQDVFNQIGYQSNEQFGALMIKAGFALNPLKYALGIAEIVRQKGADLFENTKVEKMRKEGANHLLQTTRGVIRANKVLIATNGFYEDGLHRNNDHRILPVISNIVTTRPLTDEERSAHNWRVEEPICNTRTSLFYFRMLKDNRLLFGARGDWTGRPNDAFKMQQWMMSRIHEIFPKWKHVEMSHYWRGLVCMSLKRTPSVGFDREDPSIFYAYGYHANGVNTASWSGKQIAKVMVGKEKMETAFPLVMRGHSDRFPIPNLRVPFMRMATFAYSIGEG